MGVPESLVESSENGSPEEPEQRPEAVSTSYSGVLLGQAGLEAE